MTTTTATPISHRLKTETQPLHDDAESHTFQRALLKGQLTREAYAAHMEQMLLLHQSLEAALRSARDRDARVQRLVKDEYFQAPRLMSDLAHFGFDGTKAEPTTATTKLCEQLSSLAESNPVALIGHLYVLEGSNNGGRFIAMAVRKAYELENAGVEWLDPYGEAQRGKWGEFKTTLDELQFSDDEADAIVNAAGDMFRGVSAMADDLCGPDAVVAVDPKDLKNRLTLTR